MECNDTIEWVLQNQKKIKARAIWRLNFAPYGAEEHMQEAFIAALKAYKRHPDTSTTQFRRIFWRIFNDQIAEMAPLPPKHNGHRIGNSDLMSLTSVLFENGINNSGIEDRKRRMKMTFAEILYAWIRPALTENEASVLHLYLRLGNEGYLSERDIARRLEKSRARVRELLQSSLTKINRLIEERHNKMIMLIMFKELKALNYSSFR